MKGLVMNPTGKRTIVWLEMVALLPLAWGCSASQGGSSQTARRGDVITAQDIEAYGNATSVEDVILRLGTGVMARRNSDGQTGLSLMAAGVPLIVIDGVPQEGRGNIGINPRDVERIELIKSGGALAAYGFRGSGGVILITTKRARRE
jgi:TonB-dependent SusC/RagA subfamily outer membrane receptor